MNNKIVDNEVLENFDKFVDSVADTEVMKNDLKVYRSLLMQFLTEPATIDWSKMKPLSSKFEVNYEDLPECRAEDVDDVMKRVSTIKLNGGLGTTMKCEKAKCLIPVRDGLTFLDFAIQQNKRVMAEERLRTIATEYQMMNNMFKLLNDTCKSSVPLILMNSFFTDVEVKEALRDRNVDNIKTFLQSRCPRIYKDTMEIVPASGSVPSHLSWYPPGHGNIFQSMSFTGILDELLNEGRDVCFISNVDNTGATVDPRIAKYMIDSDMEYAMECTDKTAKDIKGGVLIEIYGKIMHLEIPQVPPENIEEFRSNRTFKSFNTNNIWVNLKHVKQRLNEMKMEVIVNEKALPEGQKVIQLETSIGGAIRNFDRVSSLKVSRKRFLPVKTSDDLHAIMGGDYQVNTDYVIHPISGVDQ